MCVGATKQIREPEIRICPVESMWKAPALAFPEHAEREILSSEFDSFPAWRHPSTWSMCGQWFCSFWEVFAQGCPSRWNVLTGWCCPGQLCSQVSERQFPRRSQTPRGRLCKPDMSSIKKDSDSSDLRSQRKQPPSWADWHYFTLSVWHSQTEVSRTHTTSKARKI